MHSDVKTLMAPLFVHQTQRLQSEVVRCGIYFSHNTLDNQEFRRCFWQQSAQQYRHHRIQSAANNTSRHLPVVSCHPPPPQTPSHVRQSAAPSVHTSVSGLSRRSVSIAGGGTGQV